ncbi:MAG: hypothetical protein MUP98_12700 [Candidatus Aminicenantes bacterium]|nr:hypothetical protein [Candidatus Aminicenantes bacterium]
MNHKRISYMCCLNFVFFVFVFTSTAMAQKMDNQERESIEKFLKTAKDVSVMKDQGRRTDSWIVDLDDGKKQGKGFFKLTNRNWSNPSGGDSFKYVLAGYELDKMLDLNLVPPTVERKIQKKKGSLMLYLEPSIISEDQRVQQNLIPPDPDSFKKTMCDLVVFEHLIYFQSLCNQRDLENILIQTDLDWKVWMVDLSDAFAPSPRLIEGCEITDCSDNLLTKIENLSKEGIQARLGSYLSDEEIAALIIRKNLIVKKVKELRSKKI